MGRIHVSAVIAVSKKGGNAGSVRGLQKGYLSNFRMRNSFDFFFVMEDENFRACLLPSRHKHHTAFVTYLSPSTAQLTELDHRKQGEKTCTKLDARESHQN